MGENTITMIITLGKRDVTLDGKVFDSIEYSEEYEDLKEGFRDNHGKKTLSQRYGGEIIYKNYNKYISRLQFPIVESMIRCVLTIEHNLIDRVFIVVTDQKDDKHQKDDTLYFGEIVQKWIKVNFNNVKDKKIEYVKGNVADLGYTNEQFKDFYYKKFNKKIKKDDKLYIANNGGIDAINTAVLINGIMKFKNNCMNLYLSEDRKESRPINFVNSFLLEIEKDRIKKLLGNYDYVGVLNIINANKELEEFKVLIELAKNRLYFNLDECRRICFDYLSKTAEKSYISYEVENALNQINEIENSKIAAIQELYINCRIKYFQEQYVDFLLRIFRLEEAISRRIVEDFILHVSTDNEDNFSAMTKKIEKNEYLESYLNSYGGKELHWRNNCNIRVLNAILEFCLKENKDSNGEHLINDKNILEEVNKSLEISNYLYYLTQLRNKSIGAHGFKGVSKEKIEMELKNKCDKSINDIFTCIEELIDKRFEDSWYDKINNIIINNLK